MKSPWIRRAALLFGAVVLLLVITAAVLITSFDANRYKAVAIDWMKQERQRTLDIDGPIALSFFPRLAIKVSKVRLSEAERARGSEFASIDEAALSVQVWPLLKKQLVIDRVSAKGVRATYSRDTAGGRNIDDLVGRKSEAGNRGEPGGPGGAGLRFAVSAVQLEDVQLRVRDDMANLAADIVLHSLTAGRLSNQAEAPVTLRASATLSKPQAAQFTVDGHATLRLDLDRGSLALSGLGVELQGDAGAVKGASIALDGALAWDGSTLSAGPLRLAVKRMTAGATVLAPSTLAVQKLRYNPAGQQLDLEALQLALAGKQGGNPFELTLGWPQLTANAQQLKGSALTGRYTLGGSTALAGTLRSGAPTGYFDALRLPEVAVTLTGRQGERKMDGTLKADLLLHPARVALALERIDLAATLGEPNLAPMQLSVKGRAHADAKAAQWSLEGALNSNRFDSSGEADLSGAVPRVKARARFDSLDLNKLMGGGKPAPTAPSATDTAVPLDALRAVNGQFGFSANALAVRQYRVNEAKLEATLESGVLRMSRLSGRTWGGIIDASGSADARNQRVAVKLNASGVNVNALLRDVAGKDLLDGTGRVNADVTSHGGTVAALRSNLAGTASLQLRDGAIKGINLARTLRQAKAALSMKQDAVSKARETEKTDFSELNATARIANGVAQSDDLDLKSPFLRIAGSGRFDIGRGLIDYTARASVVQAPVGQDAGELAALRGVTVPVQLSGPFDAIDWKIQWSGVAAAAVESRLKEKLSEKLGAKLGATTPAANAGAASSPATSPKDQLRNKLKGLFK